MAVYVPAQRLLTVEVFIPPGIHVYVKGPLPYALSVAAPVHCPKQQMFFVFTKAPDESTVIVFVCTEDCPHPLTAVTDIVPTRVLAVTFIELVLELPDKPKESVHEYDIAPTTGETEYKPLPPSPPQITEGPLIAPGVEGGPLQVLYFTTKASSDPAEVMENVPGPPSKSVV